MARPLLIDGKLPMKIFINNGYRYAVTRTSVRKADGRYNHPQRIWGTIDENLNFTPNERFLALDAKERAGILVPAEWKIISPEATVKVKRGHPSYDREGKSLLYGHTWFLDLLSDQCGLKDDLEHVFENTEKAAQILTVAYYNLLDMTSCNHLESEQSICWYPCKKPLSPLEISRLATSITEAHKQALFRCRKHRSKSKSWRAVDSTNFTCFDKSLDEAKWASNMEQDQADQPHVLVVYDATDGMPVHYRKMPGNLPDTRTMRTTLQELKNNDFTNLLLVLDQEYVSKEVRALLIKQRQNFAMLAKNSDPQINQAIQRLQIDEMTQRQNWIDKHQIYGKVFDYNYTIASNDTMAPMKSMKFCLFFDPELQGEHRKAINSLMTEMEKQLDGMIADKQRTDDVVTNHFSKYFSLALTSNKTLKSYLPDDEKITAEVKKVGCFAIITNGMAPSQYDLSEMLDIYKMHSEQEKTFIYVQSKQEERRFRTSTKGNIDGRLFIQFVALTLNCIISRKYQTSETLQKLFPTRKHMLDELKSIRLMRHPKRAKLVTEIVGKQIEVFKEFKLPVPLNLLPKDERKTYAEVIAGEV